MFLTFQLLSTDWIQKHDWQTHRPAHRDDNGSSTSTEPKKTEIPQSTYILQRFQFGQNQSNLDSLKYPVCVRCPTQSSGIWWPGNETQQSTMFLQNHVLHVWSGQNSNGGKTCLYMYFFLFTLRVISWLLNVARTFVFYSQLTTVNERVSSCFSLWVSVF